jgi:hypothetical protein
MDIQALAAKIFGKPWNTFSKEEKSYAEKLYSAGQSSVTSSDSGGTTSEDGPLSLGGAFNEGIDSAALISKSITEIDGNVNELIIKAQEFGNSMGIGRARASELRTTIADTVPELMKLGVTQDEALSNITAIPGALKTNTILASETIVELGATAKFTGQDISTLVTGFQEVGVQLSDVGDKMADAANYAKSIGVNVKSVTEGVVTNLKNLNLHHTGLFFNI